MKRAPSENHRTVLGRGKKREGEETEEKLKAVKNWKEKKSRQRGLLGRILEGEKLPRGFRWIAGTREGGGSKPEQKGEKSTCPPVRSREIESNCVKEKK